MGALVLQLGCTIKCPHGGMVIVANTNTRVKVGGNFALLATDTYAIADCPFTLPGPKPSPCIVVQWLAEATRAKVDSKPVLLETSVGLCKSAEQAVQGTALITGVQTRVKAV